MRRSQSRSSASLVVLASESIGVECCTLANWPLTCPPTRWVGESGVISSGYFDSNSISWSIRQAIEFRVADFRVVEDVVTVLVVADLVAQSVEFLLQVFTGGHPDIMPAGGVSRQLSAVAYQPLVSAAR